MSITNVQHHLGSDGGPGAVSSVALTGSVVGSGNLVVGAVQWGTSASQTITVADDKGNTYNLSTFANDTTDTQGQQIFWLNNITNGPSTITATFHSGAGNTSSFVRMEWDEFAGVSTAAGTGARDGETAQSNAGNTGANAQTSGSITTTSNGDLIWAAFTDAEGAGATWSAGTGFTILNNGTSSDNDNMGSEWQIQSTAGSIAGTFTQNVSSRSCVGVIAFKAASGGGTAYTLAGAEGAFSISGQAATEVKSLHLAGAGGAFVINGQAATLAKSGSFTLSNAEGAFVINGASTSSRSVGFDNAEGTFVINGQTATLTKSSTGNFTLAGAEGTFSISGQAASTAAARKLSNAEGAFVINGQAATESRGRSLSNTAGAFTIAGQTASELRGIKLGGVEGAFAINGQNATLTKSSSGSFTLAGAEGAFVINGQAAALSKSTKASGAAGSFAINGQSATEGKGLSLSGAEGAFSISGQPAGETKSLHLTGVEGAYVINGGAMSTARGLHLANAAGAFAVSGKPSTFGAGLSLKASGGAFVINGGGGFLNYIPAGGSVNFQGYGPQIHAPGAPQAPGGNPQVPVPPS